MSRDVLIIDDSEGVRILLELLLRAACPDLGACHHAESGTEALSLLASGAQVGLILTDLHMPGMSGRELIQNIRSRAQGGTIPIAVVSADQGRPTREELTELGAFAFISKPVSTDAVQSLVRKWLSEARGA